MESDWGGGVARYWESWYRKVDLGGSRSVVLGIMIWIVMSKIFQDSRRARDK